MRRGDAVTLRPKTTGNPCAAWAGRARADEFRPAHGGTSGSKSNLVGGGTKLDVFVLRSDYDLCERMTRPSGDKCTVSRVESTANTLCQIFPGNARISPRR